MLVAVRAVSVNNAERAETLAPAASETPVPPTSGPELTPEPSAAPTAEPTATPEPTPEPSPEYFTVSMVGDCTLAEAKTRRGWGTALQTVVGKNYDYPFAKTVQYFEKDYLTIANLECNLSDKYYDSIEQFVFLAPADYANILTAGSVEFVTLANNHTMDFGQSAYDDTAAALDAVGVAYAGEDETYIYEKDGGVKVGIYCLYNQLTYNAMSILSAQAQEKLVAASRDKIAAGLKSLEEAGADFTIARGTMNPPTCRPSSAATPWTPASTPCTARMPTGSSRRRIITAALSSTVSATLFSAATPTPATAPTPALTTPASRSSRLSASAAR